MSKDKPEVGDVWKHKQSRFAFYISNIDKKSDWLSSVWENGYVDKQYLGCHFKEYNTYLGKSKANINDLFEVQDEPQS